MSRSGLRFLFWCAHSHHDFRIPEFEALGKIFGIPLNWVEKSSLNPWVILDLPSESAAKQIISRSISTRYCVQLWGDGTSYNSLHDSVKSFPKELIEPFCTKDSSFKVSVESFMNKLSLEERLKRIESFSYLPFQGRVQLTNPDHTFSFIEFHGFDHNNLPEQPLRLFFGRWLGDGQRDTITKHSIKTRKFIGNTTMDPELSLLMANLAAVSTGSLVMDPFVGTGSILIAASQFGGYVLGTDIDYLMLHARTRPSRVGQKKRAVDESMFANFQQYGLGSRFVDILVSDNSTPPWRPDSELFDAIVTDPPYGIREPTERVGTTRENKAIPEEMIPHHIPSKVEYNLSEMYADLLEFSAQQLTKGGRVVFWIPVNREQYSEEKLPKHSKLKLIANCEQVLSSHSSRRCLVMEKVGSKGEEGRVEVDGSTDEFREKFYKAQEIGRIERKRRLKEFGHLNMEGDGEKQ